MTLRTRTPGISTASPSDGPGGSGPGRARRSDGRLPSRPRGRGRIRGRDRTRPDPVVLRRRAEALLGGRAGVEETAPRVADPPGGAADPAAGAGPEPGEPLGAREARGLALRERLPVWVQVRCGMEPRTVAAVAVVLVVAVGFAAQQYWSGRPRPVTAPAVLGPGTVAAAPVPSAGPAGAGARIVVDVGGRVRDPGVRRLPSGSRVEDALAAAGGVRPGTDTTGLNRARVLVDGEQVLVGVTAQPAAGGPAPGGGAGGGAGPLSLAGATVEQLDGLPGVGPVLARNIVEFRTARGGFRAVEDLRQVDGIGERRFAELRRLVRP
ncbi:ComEA family DNA-binding protein [Streptomyces sp. WAC07061]|uniref:ComEA family DNA-binding protein n=1 Tax=Streptomyces sp. WAC07061 TaxID=2487410 RepID=UPI000F7AC82B|nr:ComEA family DNA-binding protein [Streptomyces sp. WAC07061]RSS33582.1 ComEA family DNA-binding protein [Streptomyces sp. WAC07061]